MPFSGKAWFTAARITPVRSEETSPRNEPNPKVRVWSHEKKQRCSLERGKRSQYEPI